MAGVPRVPAILNGTIGAAFLFGMHSFYVIPFCLFLHIAFVVMTKRDPQFFDCFKRHMKQKGYYST